MVAAVEGADFQGDASLRALVDALEPHREKALVLHYGERAISPGYHVTEVKAVSFSALDCGGNRASWQETVLQIEDIAGSRDAGHMQVGKFLAILNRVGARLPLSQEARVTFEIGAPGEPMQVFDAGSAAAASDRVDLTLAPRAAICKPRHRARQSDDVSGQEARAAASCC